MAYYNYKIVIDLMIEDGFIGEGEDCWPDIKKRYKEIHGREMKWSGTYYCDFWELTGDYIVWLKKKLEG